MHMITAALLIARARTRTACKFLPALVVAMRVPPWACARAMFSPITDSYIKHTLDAFQNLNQTSLTPSSGRIKLATDNW